MFRLEDLQVYMLRLFLEYARLVADDDIDMASHHPVTQTSTFRLDWKTAFDHLRPPFAHVESQADGAGL